MKPLVACEQVDFRSLNGCIVSSQQHIWTGTLPQISATQLLLAYLLCNVCQSQRAKGTLLSVSHAFMCCCLCAGNKWKKTEKYISHCSSKL